MINNLMRPMKNTSQQSVPFGYIQFPISLPNLKYELESGRNEKNIAKLEEFEVFENKFRASPKFQLGIVQNQGGGSSEIKKVTSSSGYQRLENNE